MSKYTLETDGTHIEIENVPGDNGRADVKLTVRTEEDEIEIILSHSMGHALSHLLDDILENQS